MAIYGHQVILYVIIRDFNIEVAGLEKSLHGLAGRSHGFVVHVGDVHVIEKHVIWPLVTCGVWFARADGPVVWRAEDFDQPVAVVDVLFMDLLGEVLNADLRLAQHVSDLVGVVEHHERVLGGLQSPVVDLLEMGPAIGVFPIQIGGVDVERDHVHRKPQGVQAGVGVLELLPDVPRVGVDLLDFANRGAVYLL